MRKRRDAPRVGGNRFAINERLAADQFVALRRQVKQNTERSPRLWAMASIVKRDFAACRLASVALAPFVALAAIFGARDRQFQAGSLRFDLTGDLLAPLVITIWFQTAVRLSRDQRLPLRAARLNRPSSTKHAQRSTAESQLTLDVQVRQRPAQAAPRWCRQCSTAARPARRCPQEIDITSLCNS